MRFLPLLVAFIILFIVPEVHGNSIWIKSPHTQIDNIFEVDEVVKNDLYIDMLFQLYVNPGLANFSNDVTIEFEPWFNRKHGVPEIYNVSICEEGGGYGASYTFGSISIDCKNYLENVTFQKIENLLYYPNYLLTIPIKNLTSWKSYTIHITYKIPDFVLQEGSNYMLAITSRCNPNDTCKLDKWSRYIRLPSTTSILEDLSGSVSIVGREKDRWIFGMNGGGPSFIRYYDSTERETYQPLIWAIVGAILGFMSVIVVDNFKKVRLKISDIDMLEDKSSNGRRFFRVNVENRPLGVSIRMTADTAMKCKATLDVFDKHNKKIISIEGLKWASMGEPWDIVFSDKKVELSAKPYLFETTKYEDIPSGSSKLLDIVWKIEGVKECYIRTPYNYFGIMSRDMLKDDVYLLNLSVTDDKGNTTLKNYKLMNVGTSLDGFKVIEK